MTRARSSTALDRVLVDFRTAVAEAVRYIYYTGSPRRRNVRISRNNAFAEYWDGAHWWTKAIRDVVDEVAEFALGELEHCLDWSEELSDRTKAEFEGYIVAYRADGQLRESVREQVIAVMIEQKTK